ncbi:Hypothetical predicted protein [Pelobates cultripes]|uniref:Uncharacterized protein n=1 Tax=Pelobates cultripes TaxID=61616 RepID=A0AAD1TJH8_PELCU|nr:Hypothetical predicted protein [Pelobates cultripes]
MPFYRAPSTPPKKRLYLRNQELYRSRNTIIIRGKRSTAGRCHSFSLRVAKNDVPWEQSAAHWGFLDTGGNLPTANSHPTPKETDMVHKKPTQPTPKDGQDIGQMLAAPTRTRGIATTQPDTTPPPTAGIVITEAPTIANRMAPSTKQDMHNLLMHF